MTADEIYLNIARETVKVIETENWTKAKVEFEIAGEGVVGYTGDYLENNLHKDMSVENMDDDITEWLKELHEMTTQGGNNRWNRSVFTLSPDGKFNMEFIWDQELHDEVERLAKG